MERCCQLNWYRVNTVVVVTVFLAAFWWGAFTIFSNAADVALVRVPDKSYRLQMPPESMQIEIERLMRSRKAPHYTVVTPTQMHQRCKGAAIILGCTKSMMGLKVVYVSSKVKGRELHMVLVHEFAHYLFDWRH